MSIEEQAFIQVKALKEYFPIQHGKFQWYVADLIVVDDISPLIFSKVKHWDK